MSFEDYLLHLFYLIDTELEALKALNLPRLRQRGPEPTLADSEVITMELAGEFQGLDQDKAIYRFFRRYHLREFPALARVDRTTFVRQAANLWRIKQELHVRLVHRIPLHEQALWLVDSFPLHVCQFARAKGSKLFAGIASFGYDHLVRNTFYGLRVHVRCSDEGPIAQVELTPAQTADLEAVAALVPAEGGVGIGDRNYWSVDRMRELLRRGFLLLAPYKSKRKDPQPQHSRFLRRARKLVETIIGQLVDRFHCKKTWARDLWHLCHRLIRKVLSHTTAILLNIAQGNPPLQLALLIDQ